MVRPPLSLIRKIYCRKESWVGMSKSIWLSTAQAEMYVWIIRGWAMDSQGLFCVTSVTCDFPIYIRSLESMPQRLFVLDSHSQEILFKWRTGIQQSQSVDPPDLTALKSFILPMHHSTSLVSTPKENSCRLYRGRYFLSCWHFVLPRHVCQCYGNLSRRTHGGLLNMFSRHGMFIKCALFLH